MSKDYQILSVLMSPTRNHLNASPKKKNFRQTE